MKDMRFFLTHSLIVALVIGCASTTKDLAPAHPEMMPPEYQVRIEGQDPAGSERSLKGLADSARERGVKWWARYRTAQAWFVKNPEKACELLVPLAQDPEFPLRRIAGLRAQQVCITVPDDLEKPEFIGIASYEDWLKPLALDVALEQARRHDNRAKIVEYSVQKSKQSLIHDEKIALTKEALELARGLGAPDQIRFLEKRLYQLAPSLNPNPTREEYLEVAADFRRERDFLNARKYYDLVIADRQSSYTQRYAALKGVAMAYKLERDKDKYVVWMEKALAEVERARRRNPRSQALARLYHDAAVALVRAHWTNGGVKPAKRLLEAIPRRLGRAHSAAEVYWLRGRMAEERGDFRDAVAWFEKAKAERISSTDFREKVLWYLAWNEYKLGNFAGASQSLKLLQEATGNAFARAKFSFWLGKSLHSEGQTAAAVAEYQRLIEEDPIGYYGLLAHRELKKPIVYPGYEPGAAKASLADVPEELVEILNPTYVKWLIAVEEQDIARRYLDHISRGYRKQNAQSQHAWITLLNFYAQAGIYVDLFQQLGQMPSAQRAEVLALQPDLIFPTPYRELVRQASDRFKVSADFIFAIIRQESAFNPRARSPADAFGLMQILPEIAADAAPKIDVAYRSAADLYDPHVNIPVGAFFLRSLLDKYQDQFILAAASYNASDQAIRGWLETRFRGDVLAFIEDIPYEETQGYIKLVMRNLVFYGILNNRGQPAPFPEWCLNLSFNPDA